MTMKQPAACILASGRSGTLYTGVTSHLMQRVWQRREHLTCGFTAEHDVILLVCFELHPSTEAAIPGEKQIRKWRRAGKLRLIEAGNPYWRDSWPQIATA